MSAPGFLNLRGINGQIAVLVVASIAALHLIVTTIFLIQRPDQPNHSIDGHGQLAVAVRLIGAAPASERPILFAMIARAYPDLDLQDASSTSALGRMSPELHRISRHLGADYRVFALTSNGQTRRIGIALPDGTAVSANAAPDQHQPPFWGGPWMTTLLFAVISVTLLSLWAARALTKPLSLFAKAAENFSLNGAAAPLPERGPEEIRFVARALNNMRERIAGLIDDRTKMLAAISHDLRTPITRMRLRSEFIEDEACRTSMFADLDQMRSMLESVLSFLRNDRKLEPRTLVDIASTLQLIADQFADMGHEVAYAGPGHAMAVVRPDDLHRCVTNIVANAVRFGTHTTVRLTMSPDRAIIEVEDDGPGISDSLKQDMLKPFARGDSARNMDEDAGFGLGLSIAQTIVLAHDGNLSLHDRAPHGLNVRIGIPLLRDSADSSAKARKVPVLAP